MIKLLLKLSHHQQKPKMCFYVYLSASIAYYKSFRSYIIVFTLIYFSCPPLVIYISASKVPMLPYSWQFKVAIWKSRFPEAAFAGVFSDLTASQKSSVAWVTSVVSWQLCHASIMTPHESD